MDVNEHEHERLFKCGLNFFFLFIKYEGVR
jgi:hypothetical protein